MIETLAESGGTGEERFSLDDYPLTARVLRDQEAVQVLVGDPEADRREVELLLSLGHRSLLIVPVVSRGESLGVVEAYSRLERPWTRTEINHARIISNQFGSVILAQFRSPAALAASDAQDYARRPGPASSPRARRPGRARAPPPRRTAGPRRAGRR